MVYVAVIFWCCIQREPRWWTLLPFVLPLGYWLGMALVQRLSHPRWYWPVRVTLLLLLVALAVGLMQLQNVLLVSPQRVRLFYFLQEAVMLWLMVAVIPAFSPSPAGRGVGVRVGRGGYICNPIPSPTLALKGRASRQVFRAS